MRFFFLFCFVFPFFAVLVPSTLGFLSPPLCWVFFAICFHHGEGFPDSLVGKESTCNAGDPGLIPGLG